MSWTKEETSQFQIDNNEYLEEVNSTLRPDSGLSGKVGIFCPGQVGDLATVMSVLQYRNQVFPGKEIIWYCNMPNADLLRYSPVSEVRPWPWAGNGLPESTPDFYPLLCTNSRLNHLAKDFELTKDLDDGYFPTPWMATNRSGDYPTISRKVFGVDPSLPWHPCLSFSQKEIEDTAYFMLPISGKTVMIETFCGSSQSIWNDETTIFTLDTIRKHWGSCNFLFASHKNHEQFKDQKGYISCAQFTARQTALLINYCDLFIGISSGISVVTSYLGSKPVPKLQFCGSHICSTVTLATGPITLITHDNKSAQQANSEYQQALIKIL